MASDLDRAMLDWPATIGVVGGSDRLRTALSPLGDGQSEASLVTFESARAAVQDLDAGAEPDAIVSAQSVPDGTGIELLRRVRERRPDLPFVLAGPDVTVADEREAIAAGATDVVRLDPSEPSGDAVLRARIERAVARTRPTAPPEESHAEQLVGGAHETVQRLFDAPSRRATAEGAVEAAITALPLARAAVYRFDRDDRHLRRVAAAPDDADAAQAGEGTDLWETYVSGTPRVIGTGSREGEGTAISVPLGEFGVLRVAVERPERFDCGDRERLSALSTAATAAFEQRERDRARRHRERTLDQQAARLDRRRELADALASVQRATVGADSREALEERVCEAISDLDPVSLVRIGAVTSRRDRVEPRTWAGSERGYLDAVDLELAADGDEPAVRAARSESAVAVDDVTAGLRSDTWRGEALARGFQSVLSLPLTRDDRLWGTLTVHASDPDAFDGPVRRVLGDVAEALTDGLAGLQRRRALRSDTVTDLELTLADGTDTFSRVARETGATLSFEGALSRDGAAVLFLTTADGAPAAVEAAFESAPLVDAVGHVPHGDGALFEVALRPSSVVSEIVTDGGTLRDLTADGETTALLVTVSAETDVRRFVESLERVAPDVRLRSRTQRTRSESGGRPFRVAVERRLTDRQAEALRTALLSGYFEWPREHTAEEVAGLLDISQPTFNRHLRVALRKLLVCLFDADEP